MQNVKGGTVMKKIAIKRLAVHAKAVKHSPVVLPQSLREQLQTLPALPKQSTVSAVSGSLRDFSVSDNADKQLAALKKLGTHAKNNVL